MTTDATSPDQQRRAALSALMDGEAVACDDVCRSWRADAATRADWHAYHVIGDLMRSDEHRAETARDTRLLARVREQLAREPVVLAPTAPSAVPAFAQKRRARAWMMPTAVAAGFAVVAGALVVTRVSAPDAADVAGVVASNPVSPAVGVRPVAVQPDAVAAPTSTEAGAPTMIRSAELDRYLAAHRQYANGAWQVAPGGVVRQAAVAAPGR